MSHNIKYYTYPQNCNKRAVEDEINAYVKRATWEEGGNGLPASIRWIDSNVYDSYEAAEQAIKSYDSGWYDQIAVLYKELPRSVTNKKIESLEERISETWKQLSALDKEVAVKTFKAQLVTCKGCNSKLNKDYIKGNFCPLCRTDMRSETTQKRLAAMREKHKTLQNELLKEREALAAKKGTIKWLVKIEYHT